MGTAQDPLYDRPGGDHRRRSGNIRAAAAARRRPCARQNHSSISSPGRCREDLGVADAAGMSVVQRHVAVGGGAALDGDHRAGLHHTSLMPASAAAVSRMVVSNGGTARARSGRSVVWESPPGPRSPRRRSRRSPGGCPSWRSAATTTCTNRLRRRRIPPRPAAPGPRAAAPDGPGALLRATPRPRRRALRPPPALRSAPAVACLRLSPPGLAPGVRPGREPRRVAGAGLPLSSPL